MSNFISCLAGSTIYIDDDIDSKVAGRPRAIEDDAFPFEALSDVAEIESWRKEINRPLYHIHKWWAQRLGAVFRSHGSRAHPAALHVHVSVAPGKHPLAHGMGMVTYHPDGGVGVRLPPLHADRHQPCTAQQHTAQVLPAQPRQARVSMA